uniref:F-box domain-containing protein n=1 Tax=Amphimedon queenslandica TaxID=400682 RepID=A0A1X7VN71_AMPQE
MASQSYGCKRLKLDPEFVDEQPENGHKEQEHQVIPVHQLFSLDGPVKEDKEYSSLDSLPKEIIQEICMLLSLRDKMSLRLVNRQLYTICSDPYLWTNVFIDDAYHKINAPFVKSVLKTCHPHVQSLSLRGQLPFSLR